MNQSAVTYLSALSYRTDAERRVCLLPLGSIYWDDEIPDFVSLMKLTEEERDQILRLFAIRLKLWDGITLSEDEQRFWDEARLKAPTCPLFRRLELSTEDQQARQEVEQSCAEALEAFLADADRVTVSESQNGLQTFSATFDLTKARPAPETKKPWWRRLFSKRVGEN